MKEIKSHRYIQTTFPGWNCATNYEFAVLGRIWVVCDPLVSLSIHFKSTQMITCVIQIPRTTTEVSISYVCGLNSKNGRQQLWQELRVLARDPVLTNKPWAIMGDFNQILHPSEKSNGGIEFPGGIQEFRDYVSYVGLFDLSIRGNLFTWWNNQEANPIAKKLDQILINDRWQLRFPLSFDHFGEPDISDHSPVCLVLGNRVGFKKQLMVSHFFLQHQDFLPRVVHHWHSTWVAGSEMFSFYKKLKLLKHVIMDINREHFSNLENSVKEAHSNLLDCQNHLLVNPLITSSAREKQAHKKWMTLSLAEEKFLLQRFRVQ